MRGVLWNRNESTSDLQAALAQHPAERQVVEQAIEPRHVDFGPQQVRRRERRFHRGVDQGEAARQLRASCDRSISSESSTTRPVARER